MHPTELAKAESDKLCAQVAEWSRCSLQSLRKAKPELPDVVSDRQQDGAEPLLAIADAAGGEWPQRGRATRVALLTGEAAQDDSTGVRLLAGAVFEQQQASRLPTLDLLAALCDAEPQWLEFNYGKALSAAGLSRLLKRYGILHRKLRIGDRTIWEYERNAFEDAWARYLPRNLEQVEQSNNDAGKMPLNEVEQGGRCSRWRNTGIASNNAGCSRCSRFNRGWQGASMPSARCARPLVEALAG